MANLAITFDAQAGKTYRLFPAPRYNLSLGDWATYKKNATEQSAPNAGKYSATVDDTYRYYRVFQGDSQPANWGLWELEIDIFDGGNFTQDQMEKIIELMRLDEDPYEPPPIILPPIDEDNQSVGFCVTRTGSGAISPNTVVFFRSLEPADDTGTLIRSDAFQMRSNASGVLTATFQRGVTYEMWRKRTSNRTRFVVPDENSFALPDVVD